MLIVLFHCSQSHSHLVLHLIPITVYYVTGLSAIIVCHNSLTPPAHHYAVQCSTALSFMRMVISPKPMTDDSLFSEEEHQRLSGETLEELDWCLDQLDTMHTHRSVGDLASTKFRKMLGKELTAFEASGSTSGSSRVSEFIINTYLGQSLILENV